MIEPAKYQYALLLLTEKGKAYDISDFVESLSWEEPERELAARITFRAKNDKTSKGRLSALAKPGCYVYVMYAYKNKPLKEAVRGRIVEWNPSAKASEEQLRVKAYDDLYSLQESQDHVYYSAGVGTRSAITQLLKKWGIKMGTYTGPDVTHGKLLYKSEKQSAIVLKILDDAKKKGGGKGFLRGVKGKVSVMKYGGNKKIYHFAQSENLLSVSHKVSTAGMATRVKVVGEEDDEGRRPVEATVDGEMKYGIRQKLVTRGTDESLDDAKKAAREILEEDGKLDRERTIKAPDMPIIRKGDALHLKSSTGTGYFHVLGVSHDCGNMTMTMNLRKTSRPSANKAEGTDDESRRKKDGKYQEGDIVNFHGGKHYVSSDAGAKGYDAGPGKAKITIAGGSGRAHPWHLVTENWSKTHVYGWVDDGTFD